VKGVLYVKLRDDPANQEMLTLPVTLIAPAAPETKVVKPLAASPAEAPVAPEAAAQPAENTTARGDANRSSAPKSN